MVGIEALMRHVYLFPIVGMVLGAIFALSAAALSSIFTAPLAAILIMVIIYKLCGINHLDGLADFGDGIVAHGSIEKKVQAMKDMNLGTGGVLFIAMILLAGFSILSSLPSALLPWALLAAEVSAKQSMIAFAAFSKSLQKGFGQIMIEKTSMREFLLGLAISAILCLAVLGRLGLAMLAASQIGALLLVVVARRNFGGATGDGIGAANEICRAVALASSLTLGGMLLWTPW